MNVKGRQGGRDPWPWEERWIPEPNTGCFLWLGQRTKKGYGLVTRNSRKSTAHRHAWELAHGPIPAGMWVLHRCDNPGCVNPEHLFLGTAQDNSDDMMMKGHERAPVRLHECEVEEIRRLHSLGVSQRLLSKMFKTANQHISRIVNYQRRQWPWVTP